MKKALFLSRMGSGNYLWVSAIEPDEEEIPDISTMCLKSGAGVIPLEDVSVFRGIAMDRMDEQYLLAGPSGGLVIKLRPGCYYEYEAQYK
jgi:hypothetical protein